VSSIKDKACWYRGSKNDKWKPATFIDFGLELGCAVGDGNYTVAIVLDSRSRRFVTIPPDDNVSFAGDPEETGRLSRSERMVECE